MFTDTIALGTTPVTYVSRAPSGGRSIRVPSGDTPANERRLEIASENNAANRVSSMVKVAVRRPHPVTAVSEEASVTVKIVRPASFTEAEIQLAVDHLKTMLSAANVTKLYNREQ